MDGFAIYWHKKMLMPAKPLSKRFGTTIRRHRMAADVSQEQLAERAGLHPTYIGMVERGIRNPTLDVAERISKALGLELSVLISESVAERSKRGRGR